MKMNMTKKTVAAVFVLVLTTIALAAAAVDKPDPQYAAQMAKWRRERESDLRQNWLTLVGLFWLNQGENRFGSDPADPVALPKGKAPQQAGTFLLQGGKVLVKVAPGVRATNGGHAVHSLALQPDTSGHPTVLSLGDLRLHIIQRGERFGVRVKDVRSEALAHFRGLQYFPLNESWVVRARFTAFDKPQEISIPTVLGTDAKMQSPGMVEFQLNGRTLRLQPVIEDQQLFFIFHDLTSGKQTYPPGRFLYTAMPKNGEVLLDFNRAHNPPCAFTPYATCPLPPKQNYLDVAIEAGELFTGH